MNRSDYDDSFVAESLPAFISEADEHIELIEQLLLKLEGQPDNRELLDSLFRSAHTIKGSAGIFGLDGIVAFTHHVETLLDKLRDGKMALTSALSTLLLECNDQIRAMVGTAQGNKQESEETGQVRENLVKRLCNAYGEPSVDAGPAVAPAATEHCWNIDAAFGQDTFRNGMDPLAILNYLRGLGTISNLKCSVSAVPALDKLDAEACYLRFEFCLFTAAARDEIESAFSFVREDCELQISGPEQASADPLEKLASMPDQLRLGELLLSAGVITPTQLHQSLEVQAGSAVPDGSSAPLGKILVDEGAISADVLSAALQKQQKQRDSNSRVGAEDTRFIRVQADRLDQVINLLGELVIATAGASLLARQCGSGSMLEASQQISSLVEEIRNGTLQLRMVPIGECFSRFRRVVRDTAAELGKDIALEVIGADTELDKSVVERIADPLMHLVRNALDHGIEQPAQRLAMGKPAQGRLTLSARHESGSILIQIADDGGGISRDRVLARAWERGLVARDVVPPDDEILKLIFEPGFSTAEKITNLSGRGVGMDVVRSNIEALRGTVKVSSDEGRGSCIEIRLPLTLAIIDGFLVSVGASKFIFPLDGVVEVIESQLSSMEMDGYGRRIVELRGQVLPVVSLRALYCLDSPIPERSSIVVIRSNGRHYGVMVDGLLGQYQTVIKPLGKMLRSLRGISGSSILGNGEVALIFDVNSLCLLAEQPVSVLRSNTAVSNAVTP